MKSRYTNLAKGNTEYRKPVLSFGQSSLSGTVLPGKRLTTEIGILSGNNVPMHLFFFSKNPRVRVSQPLQIGRTGKFTVEINTAGLHPGEALKGEIEVVYNGGETSLPYDFSVGLAGEAGERQNFETLDDFVAFASENFKEAVRLFSWKEFLELPFMHDLHFRGLYRTFSTNTGKDGGLKEFLRAAGYEFEERTQTEIFISEETMNRGKGLIESDPEKKKNLRLLSVFTECETLKRNAAEGTENGASRHFYGLCEAYPFDTLVRLLYVYFLVSEGALKTAKEELILLQDPVQKERMEKKDLYCLFLYLVSLVQEDEERLEQARKLSRRYFTDGVRTPLMFVLQYRMDPALSKDHTKAYTHLFQFHTMYAGLPMIYLAAADLFNETTEDVHVLSAFELKTLLYGLRHDLFSERKLFELLSNELKNPKLLTLYMLVLKLGYRKFRNPELLSAIVNVELQQKKLGLKYAVWYKEAIKEGISYPGLYEYYLASLPKNYDGTLPEEVVRYFGRKEKETPGIPLDLLYCRVASDYGDDAEIMALYRERMTAYVLKKLRSAEYNVRLIPVIQRILTPELLNEATAPGMLEALYLNHLQTSFKEMRRVIIHYPELEKEAGYALQGEEALVPVYSPEAVIAFEDQNGNRYFDPALTLTKVCSNETLKTECLKYVRDSLLPELSEADEILSRGYLREQDLFLVTGLIKNKKIDDFYRARLYETLVDLSLTPEMERVDCAEFLLEADFLSFTPAYQERLLTALIDRGFYKDAYRRILEFGAEGLSNETLLSLSENMMDEPVSQGDPTLLYICFQLFENGLAGPKILNFLAKYFEGSTVDRMAVLKALRKKRLPLSELLEKTLIQCLYVDNDKELDLLFDWYSSENDRNEELIDACVVLRSHQYFLEKRKLTESLLEELLKHVLRLPRCCMLAAFRYFSETKEELTEEEKNLLSALLQRAVNEDVVLGCFSTLSKKLTLPPEFEDRVFMEYRDEKADNVALVGTVFPGRKFLHRTLKAVYPGVYTGSAVLYEGEWLQYYYSVHRADDTLIEAEAEREVLVRDPENSRRGSRTDEIERLQKKAEGKDLRETAELLKSMLLRDAMIEDIFG